MNLRKDHYHTNLSCHSMTRNKIKSCKSKTLHNYFAFCEFYHFCVHIFMYSITFLFKYVCNWYKLNKKKLTIFSKNKNHKHFQQRMSWLLYRWRTQRNVIRNANCRIQWVIKTLNATCTSFEEYVFWSICLTIQQFILLSLIVQSNSNSKR